MQNRFLFFVFFLVLFAACDPAKRAAKTGIKDHYHPSHNYVFPYSMSHPDAFFEMPKALTEISGITLATNNKQMICAIQDENGILFGIDKNTGKVKTKKKFYKDGDYEDIACVNNKTFILKSSGKLYELEMTPADTFKVIKHSIGLKKENDSEGLCYDEKNNRLLIACKGDMTKKEAFSRGIYAYDLKTKKLSLDPVLKISLAEFQHYIKEKNVSMEHPLFVEFLEGKQDKFTFSPSAIAVHPLTGNYYITSSKGKILAVISPHNEILHIEKLIKKEHKQPEGLLFDEDGTLYISNEGKKEKGNIQRFKYSTN